MTNQYLPPVIAIPSTLLITDISKACPMQISFTIPSDSANTYQNGQLVRLTVPKTWGMYQANGLTGKIISVDSVANTMLVNINSTQFDAFIYNPTSLESPASLSPAGSQNVEYNNFTDRVPFQSLNNIGN